MKCGCLTARTLNNEVLPAFWRPIIVISISVALSSDGSCQHYSSVTSREFDEMGCEMGAKTPPRHSKED